MKLLLLPASAERAQHGWQNEYLLKFSKKTRLNSTIRAIVIRMKLISIISSTGTGSTNPIITR